MSKQSRRWSVVAVIAVMALTMACVLPGAASQGLKETPTPTPGLAAGGGNGGLGGNNGGSQGGTGGSNGGGTGGSSNGGSGPDLSDTATPTRLPDTNPGPYTVKQIEMLGGEVISGTVCSLTRPFGVLSKTPKVSFTFYFAPQDAQHGQVSYAYSIPKAGESHQAAGTYTVSPQGNDGTLQVSLAVSDHVVFKGFDGNIPNRYKFNLVPTNAGC